MQYPVDWVHSIRHPLLHLNWQLSPQYPSLHDKHDPFILSQEFKNIADYTCFHIYLPSVPLHNLNTCQCIGRKRLHTSLGMVPYSEDLQTLYYTLNIFHLPLYMSNMDNFHCTVYCNCLPRILYHIVNSSHLIVYMSMQNILCYTSGHTSRPTAREDIPRNILKTSSRMITYSNIMF